MSARTCERCQEQDKIQVVHRRQGLFHLMLFFALPHGVLLPGLIPFAQLRAICKPLGPFSTQKTEFLCHSNLRFVDPVDPGRWWWHGGRLLDRGSRSCFGGANDSVNSSAWGLGNGLLMVTVAVLGLMWRRRELWRRWNYISLSHNFGLVDVISKLGSDMLRCALGLRALSTHHQHRNNNNMPPPPAVARTSTAQHVPWCGPLRACRCLYQHQHKHFRFHTTHSETALRIAGSLTGAHMLHQVYACLALAATRVS